MADPGPPTKVSIRICLTCPTRLSSLTFDKHTVCEKCRGQVCDLSAFCEECRDWTSEFRESYVKHQRSLQQKRSYKERAKAKSPPVSDELVGDISDASIPLVQLSPDPTYLLVDSDVLQLQQQQQQQ